MRRLALAFILAIAGAWRAPATTLQELSLEEMTRQSTAIVRARVVGQSSSLRGSTIYTVYRIQVAEAWKGTVTSSLDVVVPGGVASGLRQTFSGTPSLEPNQEYVLFLWRGSNGLTHIIGLSQGVFQISRNSAGQKQATRPEIRAAVVTSDGAVSSGPALSLALDDLKAKVRKAMIAEAQ